MPYAQCAHALRAPHHAHALHAPQPPTRVEWLREYHKFTHLSSQCFATVSRYLAGCFVLFREFRGWGFTRFVAVSRCVSCVIRVSFRVIVSSTL